MYGFGVYPRVLSLLGSSDEVEAGAFTSEELAEAQWILDHATEKDYDELIAALGKRLSGLRRKDSLYSKLGRYGASKLQDELDAEVGRQDELRPDLAPHAAIYGPRFPRDSRARPLKGRILGVTSGKVFDTSALFGDPYWGIADPASRLTGRRMTMTTGPQKGDSYIIVTHEFQGDNPYVRLEGDPLSSGNAGDKFVIDGPGLPDDDLDKWDRGNDWLLVSALIGRLTAVGVGTVTCASVFTAAGYWLDNGTLITGNLTGRSIVIEGVGTRKITAHNQALGKVSINTTGVAGTESFAIQARSPAETGKQSSGTLIDGKVLEPTCLIRISPRSLARMGTERGPLVSSSAEMVNRYARLRFHRFRGSHTQLRFLIKSSQDVVRHFEAERRRAADIRTVAQDLDLPLKDPK